MQTQLPDCEKTRIEDAYKLLKWVLFKQYHMLSDRQLDDLDAAFGQSFMLKALYWAREGFHHILANSASVARV